MAGSITINQSVQLLNGSLQKTITPGALALVQDDAGSFEDVNSIPTSEEAVATFGSMTNEGWVYLRNIDATNYVQWGFSTGVYGGRLEPGETALFRAEPGFTLFFLANTAACLVQIIVLEN
jgi:hypothetical protein|tara:strand:- start:843 stop:1205 length:363 start_codon:yes stop_codon:yes gene_type:complete